MIQPLVEKFSQLRKALVVELAPAAIAACGKLLDEIEKGLAEEKADRIPIDPPKDAQSAELRAKHRARYESPEWKAADARFCTKDATAEDCLLLAKQELWECMYSLPPEAPNNGAHVDGWHASAAALRAEGYVHQALHRVEAVEAVAAVRVRAARALHDLGYLQSEHMDGCPMDEPCECPEYVLVGAVLNDTVRIEDVEIAIATADDVRDVE